MNIVNPWINLEFSPTLKAITEVQEPPVGGDKDQACLLFRGKEDYLSRFRKDGSGEVTNEVIEEIRQEVRALCAQWLKMQNVTAVIGAGASKYVTGFVSKGLYDEVAKILASRPSGKALDQILKLSGNPTDVGLRFEEFLSQLTAIANLLLAESGPLSKATQGWSLGDVGSGNQVGEKLSELILEVERAIAVACNVSLPGSELSMGASPITPHEALLAKLVARDPQQGRALLVTLNYDTLLEQAMDRIGIMYADGFTGTVSRRFNPACYDLDFYYPGEVTAGRVQRYDKVLHLYKIHGSINWRRSVPHAGDPFGIFFDSEPLPSKEAVLSDPGLLDHVFKRSKGAKSRRGLAILPTAAKFGESVTMPYAHLFRAMAQAMREPQTACFVIGYSGWDHHVNRIIEDSLTNPGFVCVIINRTLTDWARRLASSDQSGRVYVFAGAWGTFQFFSLEMLPDLEILKAELGIARTLRDLQKTRIDRYPDSGKED